MSLSWLGIHLSCLSAPNTPELNMDTTSTVTCRNSSGRASIMVLPNEILHQVLAELKWGAPSTPNMDVVGFHEKMRANTADIKRARLVCRSLAARGAVFLVPVVSVSVCDPSSLDHLEHMAGHRAFAPFVQAVYIDFDFYEASIANDIRQLAAHLLSVWSGPLHERIRLVEPAEWPSWVSLGPIGRHSAARKLNWTTWAKTVRSCCGENTTNTAGDTRRSNSQMSCLPPSSASPKPWRACPKPRD